MEFRLLPFLVLALLLLREEPLSAQSIGSCRFDPQQLGFEGTPRVQADCLTRIVRPYGRIGQIQSFPQLQLLLGNAAAVDRERLARRLLSSPVEGLRSLASGLGNPVSRARNDAGPFARYFVIHDTSTPNLGNVATFPQDIDRSDRINSFSYYPRGAKSKAHFFVNRRGEVEMFRDFHVPWRATKLEINAVGSSSRGLFLHIELIQPRRNDARGIDAFAPSPGFSQAQYDSLAALYVVASVRAGHWLIPAFHVNVDDGLSGGHDDPQNFELTKFDDAVSSLLGSLEEQRVRSVDEVVTPLRASFYYTALETDYPSGSDAVFRTRTGETIARASTEFVRLASIEGSAKLSDGRLVNVDGVVGGERRWRVVYQPFGLDAVGCELVPFRSAAVDPSVIPLRTRLYLPETAGMRLPDGQVHDGEWYAVDTGSAIRGGRIDLFMGAGRASMAVPRQHGVQHMQELQATRRARFEGCVPS
jgi:3D (Asp-Asp-Asp) domain-containing protein